MILGMESLLDELTRVDKKISVNVKTYKQNFSNMNTTEGKMIKLHTF